MDTTLHSAVDPLDPLSNTFIVSVNKLNTLKRNLAANSSSVVPASSSSFVSAEIPHKNRLGSLRRPVRETQTHEFQLRCTWRTHTEHSHPGKLPTRLSQSAGRKNHVLLKGMQGPEKQIHHRSVSKVHCTCASSPHAFLSMTGRDSNLGRCIPFIPPSALRLAYLTTVDTCEGANKPQELWPSDWGGAFKGWRCRILLVPAGNVIAHVWMRCHKDTERLQRDILFAAWLEISADGVPDEIKAALIKSSEQLHYESDPCFALHLEHCPTEGLLTEMGQVLVQSQFLNSTN